MNHFSYGKCFMLTWWEMFKPYKVDAFFRALHEVQNPISAYYFAKEYQLINHPERRNDE